MSDRSLDTNVIINRDMPMLTHHLSSSENTKKSKDSNENTRLINHNNNNPSNPLLSEPRPVNSNQLAQDNFTFKPIKVGNTSFEFKNPNKSLPAESVPTNNDKFEIFIPPRPSIC